MSNGSGEITEVPNSDTGTVDMSAVMSALEAPDEVKDDVVVKDEVIVPDTTVVPDEVVANPLEEELATLRAITRNQSRELRLLQDKVNRHDLVQKGDLGSEGDVPLGEVEALSLEIKAISEAKADTFETLLETMELNPKYEDVKVVCSRDNLDEIIERAAFNLNQKTGEDITVLTLKMEKEIWEQKNPYKYMYDMIKTYHPKYAVVAKVEGENNLESDAEKQRRLTTPASAPGSIHNLGGGNENPKGAGWTSEKIDALPEDQLGQVPPDIYEKYLMNQLP